MSTSTLKTLYKSKLGIFYHGEAENVLSSKSFNRYNNQVNLIFTSPPFPLNRKKQYGNLQGDAYIKWLASFAPLFKKLLKPNGSIVMEVGNAWEPSRPIMSTLPLQSLLGFLDQGKLNLCQQFIYYNPARLPSPAQWVTVERIRVKDAFTNIWWMSIKDRPKANNRKVLKEYSESMKALLKSGKYNAGRRPSEHNIGATSFLKNNNGAIPPNVLTFPNNVGNTNYLKYCKKNGLLPHPARMPDGIPDFFIRFLTNPGDLVLDPFAGSNTTGAMAEKLGRKWISIEANEDYIKGSLGRFLGKESVESN